MNGRSKLKVVSWNLNGIRAASKNGALAWLAACDADVLLLQEVRAEPEQIDVEPLRNAGFDTFLWMPAKKKGYSGVGVIARQGLAADLGHIKGLGLSEYDGEGRVAGIQLGKLAVVSAYFPNSQREGVRLPYKLGFCDSFMKWAQKLESEGVSLVVGGDYNIAHQDIDLANPKANRKNAGFLPEERDWMGRFLEAGFVDTFRMFETGGGHYTWWSQRAGVRERNIGWRIDYHCVSGALRGRVSAAAIHPKVSGSDHCPTSLSLELP